MEKIVIFDWGGVIESRKNSEYNIKEAIKNIMKKFGCNLSDDEIIKKYSKCSNGTDGKSIFCCNDQEDIEKWFDEVKKSLNLNCNFDDFLDAYYEDFKKVFWYKDLVEYAHSLKDKCKIGIFSNLMLIDKERLNDQVNLNKFDYVFLSFEMKLKKPQEEAYEIVELSTNIDPKNILFIDDLEENINTANSRGWQTCRAYGYEIDKIKNAVNNFLIK